MADTVLLVKTVFEYVSKGQLPPTDLLKLLISKGLGYGIIAGSTLVKLPQILNIVRASSAEGLSALSFELETWVLLVHTSYGYMLGLPFSAFGEAAILFIQNVILVALIYKHSNAAASRALLTSSIAAGCLGMVATGTINRELITMAYNANNILTLVARLPQIYKNFKEKSTGQLSLITYGVNTVGCIARIFTTMQEGGGTAMLRSYILGFVLNGLLVSQILLYGNQSAQVKAAAKKQKQQTKKTQ